MGRGLPSWLRPQFHRSAREQCPLVRPRPARRERRTCPPRPYARPYFMETVATAADQPLSPMRQSRAIRDSLPAGALSSRRRHAEVEHLAPSTALGRRQARWSSHRDMPGPATPTVSTAAGAVTRCMVCSGETSSSGPMSSSRGSRLSRASRVRLWNERAGSGQRHDRRRAERRGE